MRIVFSRDRPAQLDLLLRSLLRHAPEEETWVCWHATTDDYRDAYMGEYREDRIVWQTETPPENFNEALRRNIVADEHITFFCDDDVVYRPYDGEVSGLLDWHPGILTVSLRLGAENTRQQLPPGFPIWDWTQLEATDFGFPGSIDGHTFRGADVMEMLGGDYIENPTQLETILAHRVDAFRSRRPLMASCYDQRLVGVPVNRVSPDSGVEHGLVYPQTTEEMLARWQAGERIALDALDFSGVQGCHHEIPFQWEPRV